METQRSERLIFDVGGGTRIIVSKRSRVIIEKVISTRLLDAIREFPMDLLKDGITLDLESLAREVSFSSGTYLISCERTGRGAASFWTLPEGNGSAEQKRAAKNAQNKICQQFTLENKKTGETHTIDLYGKPGAGGLVQPFQHRSHRCPGENARLAT